MCIRDRDDIDICFLLVGTGDWNEDGWFWKVSVALEVVGLSGLKKWEEDSTTKFSCTSGPICNISPEEVSVLGKDCTAVWVDIVGRATVGWLLCKCFFKLLTVLLYDSFVLQMLHNATQLPTDSKKLHTSLVFLLRSMSPSKTNNSHSQHFPLDSNT